jgi:hypothetical protein
MRICPNAIRNPWSLLIEYMDNTFRWKTLATIVSPNASGQTTSTYTPYQWTVPADGFGDFFAIRMTGYGTNPSLTASDWWVDDVRIEWIDADMDNNGIVDLTDLALFAAAWQSVTGNPAYRADADLTIPTDGQIRLDDLMIFIQFWLKQ